MSAIAGCWSLSGRIDPQEACRVILRSCPDAPGGRMDIRGEERVALARRLHGYLPEDCFDRQPYQLFDGRQSIVFEGRLDNREELGSAFSLDRAQLNGASDAWLAMSAWQRWGPRCTERLLGDYALCVWDRGAARMTLVRGPLSMRSLFYAVTPWAIAFCSSPIGLMALPQLERELDVDALIGVLAGGTHVGTAPSLFRSITAVRQGQAVELTTQGARDVQIWEPAAEPGFGRSVRECGEALRAELDRAVAAQLRRADGPVAAHLSGGRDSGAVAATAANLLGARGETMLALTGAPSSGFAELVGPHLLVDEHELAAGTASEHPSILHLTCREPSETPLTLLETLQRAHGAPLLTPSNLPWWAAVNERATASGASILLTGQAGNYSVSAGGPAALRDLAGEARLHPLLAGSRRTLTNLGARNLASGLFRAMLPGWLHASLRKASRSCSIEGSSITLLRQPWRDRVEALRRQRSSDLSSPTSYRAFLRESLLAIDNAERMSGAVFGLDVRDPTADRRLVELVLRFPADAWYGAGDRPAFELAFGDRLPASVVHGRTRAHQQADWFMRFKADEVRRAFARYAAHPFVAELVDLTAVERMIEAWPRGTDWMANPRRFAGVEDRYRNHLLPTLASAAFIATSFPV